MTIITLKKNIDNHNAKKKYWQSPRLCDPTSYIFIYSTSFGWIYSYFLMGTDLAEIESDFSTVKRQGRIEIQDHAIQ